jgi:hypothetical protein
MIVPPKQCTTCRNAIVKGCKVCVDCGTTLEAMIVVLKGLRDANAAGASTSRAPVENKPANKSATTATADVVVPSSPAKQASGPPCPDCSEIQASFSVLLGPHKKVCVAAKKDDATEAPASGWKERQRLTLMC